MIGLGHNGKPESQRVCCEPGHRVTGVQRTASRKQKRFCAPMVRSCRIRSAEACRRDGELNECVRPTMRLLEHFSFGEGGILVSLRRGGCTFAKHHQRGLSERLAAEHAKGGPGDLAAPVSDAQTAAEVARSAVVVSV